ncbi:WxL domain-containing protein [Enterococcus crotali]|uniref:WxL domain-containing protein n=1 Tax=Enterococcus crotali TaxID=1453587 RepID=UPI0004714D63|nr:WxL domain-containing protein [Enterococcus crotali]OTP50645.1 hypothetical protein A5881_002069 [Enterococcus termitis]
MKLTHKLCGAALLAALGVSIALPSVTKADVADGKLPPAGMDIQFTKNTGPGDTTITTTNPEGSDVVITSGLVTTDAGTFGMRAGTPLNFGKANSSASGSGRHFFAQNFIGNAGAKDEIVTENFVDFIDDRSTADHKYVITAEITKQLSTTFEGAERPLTGAELNYLNGSIQSQTDPTNALAPTAAVSTNPVTFGEPTDILVNDDAAKGRGIYRMSFGKKGAGDVTDSEKSVKLNIQDNSELFEDTAYKGEVTWKMAVLP